MKQLKVFIADDQLLFVEGLRTLLSTKDGEIKLVGSAQTGSETIERIAKTKPDVLLLDIQMPGIDGIETVKRIRTGNQKLKIIMLTTFHDHDLIERALGAGANGYLLKDITPEQLIGAIHDVEDGNILISPQAVLKNIASEHLPSAHSLNSLTPASRALFGCSYGLTPRESEIFVLVVQGQDNTQIANELCISEKTVRNHISNVYRILEVNNRTQLVLWAINKGLL